MTGERAAYLAEVAAVLWPPPATVSIGAGRAGRPAWRATWCCPGRRPAAGAAGRPGAGRGRGPALRGQPVVAGGGPVAGCSARRCGPAPGRCCCATGWWSPTRAARWWPGCAARSAPTCRSASTSDRRGPTASRCCSCSPRPAAPVGFAKLGAGQLTRRLVAPRRPRCSALAGAALPTVDGAAGAARRAVAGTWQVLVQSALPVWRGRPHGRPRPAAHRGDAGGGRARCGVSTEAAGAPARTGRELRRPAGHRSTGRRHPGAAGRDAGRRGRPRPCRYGAWHGDWAPWNMAVPAGRAAGLGLGAVRPRRAGRLRRGALRAAEALAARGRPAAAAVERRVAGRRRCWPRSRWTRPTRRAGRACCTWSTSPPATCPTGQAEAGARLGVLGTWLLPVLAARTRNGDDSEPSTVPMPVQARAALGSRSYGRLTAPAPG